MTDYVTLKFEEFLLQYQFYFEDQNNLEADEAISKGKHMPDVDGAASQAKLKLKANSLLSQAHVGWCSSLPSHTQASGWQAVF